MRLNNPISSPRDRLSWSGQTSSAWFLMSHCLDLAHWLSGRKAQTVYASGWKGVLSGLGIDTWDWIHAIVRYEGGGDGVFEAAWNPGPAGSSSTFACSGRAALSMSIQHSRTSPSTGKSTPTRERWLGARPLECIFECDGRYRVVASELRRWPGSDKDPGGHPSQP